MDIAALTARFLFFAQKHKLVRHSPDDKKETAFLLFDMENINASIKNGLKFPCVLLQTPEVVKQGEHDSTIEQYECSFMVLKPLPKSDITLKPGIVQDCKAISDQFLNRLYDDAENGLIDGGLSNTSEGIIGPIGDGLYGWGVNFMYENGYDASVHTDDWEDLEP